MAAQKHPQGLLYLPSRKVDSHAWHQPGTSSAQQGVDRGHSSAAAPGCSPPGLLAALGVPLRVPTAR